jgi:hypothetical protein
MQFPYTKRDVDPLPGEVGLQVIFEPIILARFTGPSGTTFLIRGLLDTGSSMTILPRYFMPKLGVVSTGVAGLRTPGGALNVPLARIGLGVRLGRKDHEWTSRVGFSHRPDNIALLGREGFLDHLRVTFDGPRRMISILQPA